MKPTHFIRLADRTPEALVSLIDRAIALKTAGKRLNSADGKALALILFDASLRTRVSFEQAAYQLGAGCSVIQPGKGSWDLETEKGAVMNGSKPEHLIEAVQVLGRYVDAIGIRAFPGLRDLESDRKDALIQTAASYSPVPVINLESAWEHPCQGLADWMTLREQFKGQTRGKKFVLSWVAHPKALPMSVPNTVAEIAAMAGMNVVITCPQAMNLHPLQLELVRKLAAESGGSLSLDSNQDRALEGADVVYAKGWSGPVLYMDPEKDRQIRAEEMGKWMITSRKMNLTNDGKFMHCLPVRRNVIVSDEVLDGNAAIHLEQAENRLHVQKAVLMDLWNLF